MEQASRRHVLAVGATMAGATTVAGCGTSTSPSGDGGKSDGSEPQRSAAHSPASGTALVTLDAVPVGGAVSAKGAKGEPLIVARPAADRAVAFSAICTHMGCTVAPAGKELHCPCHGSVYQATTGRNVGGPAPRPLPEVPVHVAAGKVVTGS